MGLHVQSLKILPENLPENVHIDYFIYLLDYGWDEPLSETLKKKFNKMAKIAEANKAVVFAGNDVHFEDEVFSWHSINGEEADELLPAILITNRLPARFKESYRPDKTLKIEEDLKLILIPLKTFCETTTDVVTLIDKLFREVKEQKDLNDFAIAREMKKGIGQAIADGLILKPSLYGVGFDFKEFAKYFKK